MNFHSVFVLIAHTLLDNDISAQKYIYIAAVLAISLLGDC